MNWRWPWRKDRGHSISLGELKWDVHSHVVPGVDDGAPDMEAALEMVRGMHDLGYSGMVVTPHIMSDLYPNRRKTLEPSFEALQLAVKAEGIEMQLRLAAEYLLDQELMETQKIMMFYFSRRSLGEGSDVCCPNKGAHASLGALRAIPLLA